MKIFFKCRSIVLCEKRRWRDNDQIHYEDSAPSGTGLTRRVWEGRELGKFEYESILCDNELMLLFF